MTLQERCKEYVSSRTASFEQRLPRFGHAFMKMEELGLVNGDLVFDLGAGHCDFDYYLRYYRRWRGTYVPVDGHIDGTDLNYWRPPAEVDFFVLMETLEHLHRPMQLLERLKPLARKGIVVTVPNPEAVDVLKCDSSHVSVVTRKMLERHWFTVEERSFFGKERDSLMAWR